MKGFFSIALYNLDSTGEQHFAHYLIYRPNLGSARDVKLPYKAGGEEGVMSSAEIRRCI